MADRRRKGKLFILSGPSGVGKGTLRAKALDDLDGLVYSISCTTREPRSGEVDGVDYRFISEDDFKSRVGRGEFLEYAHVHNSWYGTLRGDVERELERGHDVLLEIDVQGALQVCGIMPEAISLFIAPPSFEELERRLRERATEGDDRLRVRLKNAETEMSLKDKYRHIIVNDDLDKACAELRGLIEGYRDD